MNLHVPAYVTLRRRMVGPMFLRRLGSSRDAGPAAAPGTDGIRSTRLRGQGPCAAPEEHRTPQPPPATNANLLVFEAIRAQLRPNIPTSRRNEVRTNDEH